MSDAAQSDSLASAPGAGADRPGAKSGRSASAPASAILPLLLIVSVALGLRIALRVGCIGSDDIGSWQVADALSKGRLVPDESLQNPIASLRYGLALPAALCIRIWGNSENVLLVYPISVSILGIFAVWDLVRRLTGSVGAAHIAGAILALTSVDIHYATVFLPDGPLAGWGLVAIWCAAVGHEQLGRRPRLAAALFVICGLLAAFSLAHKESAVQLVAGLGVWALVLVFRRQFAPGLLLVPAGFIAGLAAEHALMYRAFGDPLYRWKTIISASARNEARREAILTDSVAFGERITEWLARVAAELPSFSLVAIAGIASACVLLLRPRRQPGLSLVTSYLFCLLAMRLLELTETYSYQPRRLLPLAGCAAILSTSLLWRQRDGTPTRHAVRLGVALLGFQVGLFALFDAAEISRDRAKLAAERWVFNWARTHADEVSARGLYLDQRTFKVLTALGGFDDLRRREIHLYASDVPESYPSYGLRHERYRHGAFFFENIRVLEWLLPYAHLEPWYSIYAELPADWELLDVAPPLRDGSCGGALYRIRSNDPLENAKPSRAVGDTGQTAAEAPAVVDPFTTPHGAAAWDERENVYCGWYVWGAEENVAVTRPEHADDGPCTLRLDLAAGPAVQLCSGGPVTRPPSARLICREGEYLAIRFPLGVDRASIPGDWANYSFRVIGYDEKGDRLNLHRSAMGRLYFERQTLRAYVRVPADLYGLRVYLKLSTPGSYRVEQPAIDHYPRLPQVSRDLQPSPPSGASGAD